MSRDGKGKKSEERKPWKSLYLISFVCADIGGEEIYFDGSECFSLGCG